MNETKQRILDSAELLFGENGYAATSLRHIIAEANVNLAAIHYHFGSKQGLLDQVILRKVGPVNERRLALLDRFEAESAPDPVPVEKIAEAFITPVFEIQRSSAFIKFMGRIHSEGLMPEVAQKHFQPMIARFMSALCRALPGMPQEELLWKAHFAIGAMAHALTARPETTPGVSQIAPSRLSAMLVAFLSSGFRAPAVAEKEIEVIP